LKWLIEFGVQIHASQVSELLDMTAYMAKYHNASKNHGQILPMLLCFFSSPFEDHAYFQSGQSRF
jgi:hypothetical protein